MVFGCSLARVCSLDLQEIDKSNGSLTSKVVVDATCGGWWRIEVKLDASQRSLLLCALPIQKDKSELHPTSI